MTLDGGDRISCRRDVVARTRPPARPTAVVGDGSAHGRGRRRRAAGPATAAAAGVLALHQVGGPDAGRVSPLGRGRLTSAATPGATSPVADPDASRLHAVPRDHATAITVHDLQSTNGTTVDGARCRRRAAPVRPGERIRIGDSTFVGHGAESTTGHRAATRGDGTLQVLRPPRRIAAPAPTETIEMPTPSPSARPRGVQWAAALLPAAAGGAIAWFAHSPQFLLFALLSPVMMISTSLGDRVHWRRSRRREAATYRAAPERGRRADRRGLAAETAARTSAAPDPAAVRRCIAALPGTRLWERRRDDPDFLSVRLGTADLPSTLRTRGLARRAGRAAAGRPGVRRACATVRSAYRGSGRRRSTAWPARSSGSWRCCTRRPTSSSCCSCPDARPTGTGARWLPHWHGACATSPRDLARSVAELPTTSTAGSPRAGAAPDGWSGPWRVLVVDRAAAWPTSRVSPRCSPRARAGITAVCLDEDAAALPAACASSCARPGITGTAARSATQRATATRRRRARQRRRRVGRRRSPAAWRRWSTRRPTPRLGAARTPAACSTLGWHGLTGAGPAGAAAARDRGTLGRRRRQRSDRDRTSAPTARCASTWSPTARTRWSPAPPAPASPSCCARSSPGWPPTTRRTLLNFLLIDYKGGAAFAECARLPHTSGLVTDLDPYLTSRALRSLDSELRRRETALRRLPASRT